MSEPTCYDALIQISAKENFPQLAEDFGPTGWLWIKAQIQQESGFNPNAVSPVGAGGLMQLMPATAREVRVQDVFSPACNVGGGLRYLADQYRRMPEIPCHAERLKFALACYNGGRGYVNMALALARRSVAAPSGFQAWRKQGSLPGVWQMWDYTKTFLAHGDCRVRGKRPDWRQMVDYVEKIERNFFRYFKEDHCG